MADEYFVVYDVLTGEVRWKGQGPVGTTATQQLPEGLASAVVPLSALVGETLDLAPVKDDYCAQIDAQAEGVRGQFATPGSGQAMEYQEAVAQARALLGGTAGSYPMLTADVAAGTVDPRTGQAVTNDQEAADLILWMHAQWVAIGSAIREARLTAKVAIRAATNIGGVVGASTIDWAGVLGDAGA